MLIYFSKSREFEIMVHAMFARCFHQFNFLFYLQIRLTNFIYFCLPYYTLLCLFILPRMCALRCYVRSQRVCVPFFMSTWDCVITRMQ
jgi:hypothetical protein